MFTFDVSLQAYQPLDEMVDVRGGAVVNTQTTIPINQMHTPNRGGDFMAPHLDPATGVPLQYIQMLPGLNDIGTVSQNRAIAILKDKERGVGGGNAQRYYEGINFGLALNN